MTERSNSILLLLMNSHEIPVQIKIWISAYNFQYIIWIILNFCLQEIVFIDQTRAANTLLKIFVFKKYSKGSSRAMILIT